MCYVIANLTALQTYKWIKKRIGYWHAHDCIIVCNFAHMLSFDIISSYNYRQILRRKSNVIYPVSPKRKNYFKILNNFAPNCWDWDVMLLAIKAAFVRWKLLITFLTSSLHYSVVFWIVFQVCPSTKIQIPGPFTREHLCFGFKKDIRID